MRTMFLLVAISLAGCASVPSRPFETIRVESMPEGAEAVLLCHGQPVDSGVTPTELRSRRRTSGCQVRVTKDGYVPAQVRVLPGLSPEFWFNIPLAFLLALLPVEVEVGPSPPARIMDHQIDREPFTVRVVLKPAH